MGEGMEGIVIYCNLMLLSEREFRALARVNDKLQSFLIYK